MPNDQKMGASGRNELVSEKSNQNDDLEDDAYFPQILNYQENVPQDSLLSRDNYSTSNQQPSLINHPQKKPSSRVR